VRCIALIFLPLGILSALRYADRRWWRVGVGLAAAAAGSGALLVLAAVGLDTAGLGPAASWAFWQGTMVVLEMLLVTLYAVAVRTIDAGRGVHAAPVQSATR
jgi:hypothetical protein